jgi:hypothetical protein
MGASGGLCESTSPAFRARHAAALLTTLQGTAMMQTEIQASAWASPDDEDEMLRERIGTCIAEACGGDMPDGVAVHVVDRQVTITGRVEDVDIARRIAEAAGTPPGILGITNLLTTRVPPQAQGS